MALVAPIVAALVGASAAVMAGAEDGDLALEEETAFRAAAAAVAPAVVRVEPGITAAAVNAGAEAAPSTGWSTGLVVGAEGWIVTTAFAVPADAVEAVVRFPDGARAVGRVVARDVARSLVLLRVEGLPDGVGPPAAWAPTKELAVGQWTIALGRGWDSAAPSVAVGILSALHRSWGRSVQTDASVSPANYGGPLIDIRGRVIGVLAPLPADTAGMNSGTELYDAGIGFAVPAEDILRVLPRLQAGETLRPGIIGIGHGSRDAVNGPARVAVCRAGSPAAKAGVRPGDRIVSANGRPVTRVGDLRHVVAPLYAGDTLELELERAGTGADAAARRLSVTMELAASLPPWRRPVVGIVPVRQASTDGGAPAAGAAGKTKAGVRVAWVWPDGPAARAGIEPGDVVVGVRDAAAEAAEPLAVDGPATLAGYIGGLEPGAGVVLRVERDGVGRDCPVETIAAPADPPAGVPPGEEGDPAAVRVVSLEAAELPEPVLAVVPGGEATEPLGVVVWFDPPHGAVDGDAALRIWRSAAARHRVAVLVPGSTDPQRWGRPDIAAVARALDALRAKRAIDSGRVAVAGSGAGGQFAWLVAERLGPAVRGVALIGGALPRQASIEPAEPGRSRVVLFGGSATEPHLRDADRARLAEAGYPVGTLPVADGAPEPPAEVIAAWVEALGVL